MEVKKMPPEQDKVTEALAKRKKNNS